MIIFNKDIISGIERYFTQQNWLRTNIYNIKLMEKIVDFLITNKSKYIEFILHTSKFMTGCGSRFKNEASIKKLYNDLDRLFNKIIKSFAGSTLTEFYRNVKVD